MAIHTPVRLLVGDNVFDLGNITVATRELDDRHRGDARLGVVDTNVGEQVATLLEHAAHTLRKGDDDASPRTG